MPFLLISLAQNDPYQGAHPDYSWACGQCEFLCVTQYHSVPLSLSRLLMAHRQHDHHRLIRSRHVHELVRGVHHRPLCWQVAPLTSALRSIRNGSLTTPSYGIGQCVYNATLQVAIDSGLVAPSGIAAECFTRNT